MKKITEFEHGISFNGNLMGILIIGIVMLLFPETAESQRRDVPYVPTPNEVVEKMLDVVDVGPGDYVIDLGSGDGRIVIAAAKRGAFGHGIDIDPQRIREAKANARDAGVEDRVIFVEDNLFETDFSQASVITMYLLNSVNLKLRPKLLETLSPGTRIVSHSFNMNEWEPDEQTSVNHSNIYHWVIPARVDGTWSWEVDGKKFTLGINQEFQEVDLDLKSENTALNVEEKHLKGDRISFAAEHPSNGDRYIFSGKIEGEEITGVVQIHNGDEAVVENWSATNGN